MAEIKVERRKGGHAWIWIVLAVVAIIVAVLLLDRAGYIDLPIQTGAVDRPAAEYAVVHTPSVALQEA